MPQSTAIDLFDNPSFAPEKVALPWLQVLNAEDPERSGLFITLENCKAADIIVPDSWKPFKARFKSGGLDRTTGRFVPNSTDGYLFTDARVLVIRQGTLSMFTKRTANTPETYVGAFDYKIYREQKDNLILKLKYLIYLLSEDNQLLHQTPIQFTGRGVFGAWRGDTRPKSFTRLRFDPVVIKKDRLTVVNRAYLMKMLPEFYQTHLQSQLKPAQYLDLQQIVFLLQLQKQVCIEKLASLLPALITFNSRRRSIQRFLTLPELDIQTLWFPIITSLLNCQFDKIKNLKVAIDRTQWRQNNVLMVSLIWHQRALPLYWQLLPTIGCSDQDEKKEVIEAILPLLKGYKVVVLGDREFGTVGFANWLQEQGLDFALRLKKAEYIQQDGQCYQPLKSLGLAPGVSLFFRQVKVTKQKGFGQFNVACKWKRQYRELVAEEGWFILTNKDSLNTAIAAYQQRFGIEEMFKDCKSGGYNLEDSRQYGSVSVGGQNWRCRKPYYSVGLRVLIENSLNCMT